jgi:hypothetical protein
MNVQHKFAVLKSPLSTRDGCKNMNRRHKSSVQGQEELEPDTHYREIEC